MTSPVPDEPTLRAAIREAQHQGAPVDVIDWMKLLLTVDFETPSQATQALTYDRKVLTDVLVYHWRKGIEGCGCGWAQLGMSYPGHVADVYEQSVIANTTEGSDVG